MAKRVIAIANQKGGATKTNVTGNLAAELAALGSCVAMIDLDQQATLSEWALTNYAGRGSAEVLIGEAQADEVALDAPPFGSRLIAAVGDPIRTAERWLATEVGSERLLGLGLADLSADVVLIDCPPAMGIVTASAVAAATEIIIPVPSSSEALKGLVHMIGNLARFRKRGVIGSNVTVRVLITRYDVRRVLHREVEAALADLRSHVGVFETKIRENAAMQELFSRHIPARIHAPASAGAIDYAAFAAELAETPPPRAEVLLRG